MQILLKGGMIVTDQEMFPGDLLIQDEKIKKIADEIDVNELIDHCDQVIDVTGKLVMPGIIDPHTHYQLKSRTTTTADDFLSGSISAACGGVTTFIDYADHLPNRTLKEAAKARIEEALGQTVLDFTLHQNIINFDEKVSQELAEIKDLGISSIKIFTTYRREGYMIPEKQWADVFKRLKELELLVTIHAEDDDLVMRLETKYVAKGKTSAAMHPQIRPAECEALAVEKVANLGLQVGIPVYIVHLSSDVGFQSMQRAKQAGSRIFAETTPHYLLLTEEFLKGPEAQKYIMTPPLRTAKDNQVLWQGLQVEEIQVVATDHCSFNLTQKLQDDNCLTILPGLPGSETLLPLIHHHGVNSGLFDYPQLVRVLSTSAAKIFGLYPEKGSLEPGTDADLVIFDPQKEVTLSGAILNSKAFYTPFAGFKIKGYPVMTFLRGKMIVQDGKFCGQIGNGQFLRGNRSSLY